MRRIGLVLGAGGVAGHSFHAGVLAALEEATGWDPRDAEIVVGTSAGSIVGSLLRLGLSAPDHLARLTGERLSPEGMRLVQALGPSAPAPDARPLRLFPLRMASAEMLVHMGLRPWRWRPGKALAAALPEGQVPNDHIVSGGRRLFGERWPERTLWVCAVRLDNARRVVFGRPGAPRASVPDAVAASCAIPAFYRPVEIGGVRYVDGGVHSPTNADLLAHAGLDLVIVSSPMSAARGALHSSGGPVTRLVRGAVDLAPRAFARAQLASEVRRIRRRGTPVIAFQPTLDDLDVIGLNPMDPSRGAPIARQARASTLRRLERTDLLERLAPLVARGA